MSHRFLALFFPCLIALSVQANEQGQAEENSLQISPEQQKEAGIQTAVITPSIASTSITLPGEIILNRNNVSLVSSRIQARVEKRLVSEGQSVQKGDPLVVLSSAEIADTKANLILAAQEKKRKTELYKEKFTSKKGVQDAKVEFDRLYSTLLAYGFTKEQIETFLKDEKADNLLEILAPISGSITQTDVIKGQSINMGDLLFKLVNEESMWIDANIPSNQKVSIKVGSPVSIEKNDVIIEGKVISLQHEIDQKTRTRTIRIEVENKEDFLHSGEFVNVKIDISESKESINIPLSATVQNNEGRYVLYILEANNYFRPLELDVIKKGEMTLVVANVKSGTKFVKDGVFFVDSEFKKQNFADSH